MPYKHGYSYHPLYNVFTSMRTRCYYKGHNRYVNYGGRGIYICEEWRHNPAAFIDWAIENGWKKGLQIDRIDNDGPYHPDNCRFVTSKENTRNSNITRLTSQDVLEIKMKLKGGITPLALSIEYGVTRRHIYSIKSGERWTDISITEEK
jgi:hypothetical protein